MFTEMMILQLVFINDDDEIIKIDRYTHNFVFVVICFSIE